MEVEASGRGSRAAAQAVEVPGHGVSGQEGRACSQGRRGVVQSWGVPATAGGPHGACAGPAVAPVLVSAAASPRTPPAAPLARRTPGQNVAVWGFEPVPAWLQRGAGVGRWGECSVRNQTPLSSSCPSPASQQLRDPRTSLPPVPRL